MRPVAELEGDAANVASVESCEWVETSSVWLAGSIRPLDQDSSSKARG
jgi:hypothetical protein